MFNSLNRKDKKIVADIALESMRSNGGQAQQVQYLIGLLDDMQKEITRLNELNHEQSSIILDLQTNSVKPTEDSK